MNFWALLQQNFLYSTKPDTFQDTQNNESGFSLTFQDLLACIFSTF